MPRKIVAGLAAMLMALSLAGTLAAQEGVSESQKPEKPAEDIETLEQQSREAYAAGKWLSFYVANIKLNKQRPYEPEYLSNIVRACGRLDRKSTAYHYMLIMQKQGLAHDFNDYEDTVAIRNTEAYQYINDLLVHAGDPAGSAQMFATLPDSPDAIQALVWDPTRELLLAGTARGSLLGIGPEGAAEVMLGEGPVDDLGSINGLGVDSDRGRLWLAASTPAAAGGDGRAVGRRNALIEFDLQSLEILNRYELAPGDGAPELGNLALSKDGHVYVIDRATPTVYIKAPGDEVLRPFVTTSDLESLQDITVTPENSRIFVSDRYRGIWVIDPVAEQTAMLSGKEGISLGHGEGLEYQGGELYLLQSGIEPGRLVRLELDDTGAHVENITPVASGLPEFDMPGALTLGGMQFYLVANRGDAEAGETLVMTTSTDTGRDHAPENLQQKRDGVMHGNQ